MPFGRTGMKYVKDTYCKIYWCCMIYSLLLVLSNPTHLEYIRTLVFNLNTNSQVLRIALKSPTNFLSSPNVSSTPEGSSSHSYTAGLATSTSPNYAGCGLSGKAKPIDSLELQRKNCN